LVFQLNPLSAYVGSLAEAVAHRTGSYMIFKNFSETFLKGAWHLKC